MPAITKPIHNTPKPTSSAKVGLNNNNNNRPAKTEAQNLSNGSLTSTPDLIPTSSRTKPEATGATTRGPDATASPAPTSPIATGEGQRSQNENSLDLTKGSRYDAVQYNGQRIYGPPPEWSGPPPPKGCEVFVGKVPRDCCERELVPIFERVGQIFELRLMMNFTGLNRGFLFVRYMTREAAKRAVRELNNFEIRPNKFLGVTQSVDNQKLWISGIPKNCTAKEIKAEMERLTDGVRDVILYTSQIDKSKTRGYAFVEYESHRAAALARRKLVPGRVVLLGHEIDKVDWAEPENEVDEEIMATVRVLFIRNLMPSTSEDMIRRVFSDLAGSANCVERVKKMKDYAFVHFVNRESAESANQAAQNLVLDGSKIEVSWSKPVDKQIYNMRKQLTKVLSSPASGPMQPPILPLNPHMGPMAPPFPPIYSRSPRRRGAAGIKGLGAPGSVPLRGLVRKYVSVNPDLDSNQNSKLMGSLMSQPVYPNPHNSLMQEYCMDDLHKSWVEASQHIVTEPDESNFTRQFYQSGFHGHHPLAMAAMFAAASGVSPGGFFANPLGQAPPGCLTMIPQGSGGLNGSPFTDLDHLNGALLNMSLQNV